MGQHYRKIKYGSEGEYASTEEKYIYVHFNDTGGFQSIYGPRGEHLFTNQDWDKGKDLIDRITQILKDRDCEGSERLTEEDFKMLSEKNGGYW